MIARKNSLFGCSEWEFLHTDSDTFSPAKWYNYYYGLVWY